MIDGMELVVEEFTNNFEGMSFIGSKFVYKIETIDVGVDR